MYGRGSTTTFRILSSMLNGPEKDLFFICLCEVLTSS